MPAMSARTIHGQLVQALRQHVAANPEIQQQVEGQYGAKPGIFRTISRDELAARLTVEELLGVAERCGLAVELKITTRSV